MTTLGQKFFGKKPMLTIDFPEGFERTITDPKTFKELVDWYRKTPEAIALVNCIITDVISDGYYFEGKNTNVEKAKEFDEENNFSTVLEGFAKDMMLLGNGLLWKGVTVEEEQIKSLSRKYASVHNFENKTFATMAFERIGKAMMKEDEEAMRGRILRNIPMSTVSVIPQDKYGDSIIYRQRVRGNVSDFKDSEVIHIKDIVIPGEILGTSRMESVIEEVALLALVKDYAGYFFSNNGTPDHIFTMPNEVPNSANYLNLVSMLTEGKKISKKHGNLVFTGEVEVEKLNDFSKDMEFVNLAAYLTGVIAMVYLVPASRYGGIPAGKSSSQASAEEMQGYYRMIAHLQTKIENVLNPQFFRPNLKVSLRFNRVYKEDEVRETQIDKQMTDVAEQRLKLGLWSREAAAKYLRIPDEDLGEEPAIMDPSGKLNQGLQPNDKLMTDGGDQKRRALRTPKSPVSPFSEIKEMANVVQVNLDDFKKLVEDQTGNIQYALIHIKVYEHYWTLSHFTNGLWYQTTVTRQEAESIPNFQSDFLAKGVIVR